MENGHTLKIAHAIWYNLWKWIINKYCLFIPLFKCSFSLFKINHSPLKSECNSRKNSYNTILNLQTHAVLNVNSHPREQSERRQRRRIVIIEVKRNWEQWKLGPLGGAAEGKFSFHLQCVPIDLCRRNAVCSTCMRRVQLKNLGLKLGQE